MAEPPTDTQERATFTDPTIVHTVADLRLAAQIAEVATVPRRGMSRGPGR